MHLKQVVCTLIFCSISTFALGQLPAEPAPEPANISGFVADTDGAAIPGASIVVDGPTSANHYTTFADEVGFFKLTNLPSAIVYRVTISEKEFAPQVFDKVALLPGQNLELQGIKLAPGLTTSVDAESPAQIAVEEVHLEETQRILGVFPNFYTVFDHNAEPLTTKLKYQLAFKTSIDAVSLFAAAFLAGLDQASDYPNYVQGMKGYGQRVGANYADAVSDVMIGGAVLPALFHQDPRYFYQGSGTKKSRMWHALASPFICQGDNGHRQFNFSSIGGDLSASALTEVYYPPSNRGVALVFDSAAITTGGRMLNALAQEFVFPKLTSNAQKKKQAMVDKELQKKASQQPPAHTTTP